MREERMTEVNITIQFIIEVTTEQINLPGMRQQQLLLTDHTGHGKNSIPVLVSTLCTDRHAC